MYSEQNPAIDLTQEAIAGNRDALTGIVAWLFTTLGLSEGGGSLPGMPRPVHRAILRVLVPAEAALRRLIVLAAQGLTVTLKPAAASHPNPPPKRGSPGKGHVSPPLFQLIDPKQRVGSPRRPKARPRAIPRISYFDRDGFFVSSSAAPRPKPKTPPNPDGLVDPRRLCRRLAALQRALADIPRQAKRLARWRASQERKQPPTSTPSKPLSPLRDGPPPGHRKKPQHEVDDILAECHDLALHALQPDTS